MNPVSNWNHRLAACLVALALGGAALAAPKAEITGFSVARVGDGVRITVGGENLARPKILRVMNGTSWIAEFKANWNGRSYTQKLDHAGVEFAEFTWYRSRPPTIRVHLKLDPSIEPVVREEEGTWFLEVNMPPPSENAAEEKIDPSAADREAFEAALRMLDKNVENIVASNSTEPTVESTPPKSGLENLPAVLPSLSQTLRQTPPPLPPVRPLEPIRGANPMGAPVGAELVSIDFLNTDVIQVLRALSEQSGANIIASPAVEGGRGAEGAYRITVKMSNVPVQEALSFVTAMAGLRWAKVGNTYVVADEPGFEIAMRQLSARQGAGYETRVVPIASEDPEPIMTAVLAALPQYSTTGFYRIQLPTETGPSTQTKTQGGESLALPPTTPEGEAPATTPPPSDRTSITQTTTTLLKYLIVVGDPARVDEVDRYIRQIDRAILGARTEADAPYTTEIVPVRSGQSAKLKSALDGLLGNFTWYKPDATVQVTTVGDPKLGDEPRDVIMLTGPSDVVETVRLKAIELDDAILQAMGKTPDDVRLSSRIRNYQVVDLQYIEPIQAKAALEKQFPGLVVNLLPNLVVPNTPGSPGSTSALTTNTSRPAGSDEAKKDPSDPDDRIVPMKLMLNGPMVVIEEAKAYLRLIDVTPAQVALELRVVELSKEDARKLGIDWNLLTGGIVKFIRLNNSAGGLDSTSSGPNNRVGVGIDGRDLFGDVTASLDASLGNTKVLARPNTLALDGRPSRIFVGDKVRYVQQLQSTQNGVSVTIGEIDVGVTLQVTPRTGANGAITMDVQPTLTFLRRFDPVPGGGSLPQTSERTSQSTLVIQSGQTIAIGGLIQDQDTFAETGVPLLKDLPIIGQLFKRSEKRTSRTEVVFFLTARTIEGPAGLPVEGPRRDDVAPRTHNP